MTHNPNCFGALASLALALATTLTFAQQPIITGTATSQVTLPDALADQVRVLKGYKLSPVPLNMDGRDPQLVGLGAYLVLSGGCNDCHTKPSYTPEGDPFKGLPAKINADAFLGGGQDFGPFKSRNLTPEPDKGNLPAGMTWDDFFTTMTTGVDLDKKHPAMGPLLQVMPWPAFSLLTDRDLKAIYEFLSAIPPVSVPGLDRAANRRKK